MNLAETFCPLSTSESGAVYERLARMGARVFTPRRSHGVFQDAQDGEIVALAAEQSRFDYRLLYILVAFLAESFETLHPFHLREAIKKMRTPAVWGVILGFARKLNRSSELEALSRILLSGIDPAPPQLYYMTQRLPKPNEDLKIVLKTPSEFSGWGFYSDEIPILKELAPEGAKGTFSKEARLRILKDLLIGKKRIAVSDYLEALAHAVSRQQAHKDLILFPRIKFSSDRRGRRYWI